VDKVWSPTYFGPKLHPVGENCEVSKTPGISPGKKHPIPAGEHDKNPKNGGLNNQMSSCGSNHAMLFTIPQKHHHFYRCYGNLPFPEKWVVYDILFYPQ
jgi:hypothetical protein